MGNLKASQCILENLILNYYLHTTEYQAGLQNLCSETHQLMQKRTLICQRNRLVVCSLTTQRNWKQGGEKTFKATFVLALVPRDQQYPKGGNNPSVHQQMNEWTNVVYPHGGMLFSHEKGCGVDTAAPRMNHENITLNETSPMLHDKHCMIPLMGGTHNGNIHEKEAVEVPRGWGSCLMGYRASI